jgi:hypothetical protein
MPVKPTYILIKMEAAIPSAAKSSVEYLAVIAVSMTPKVIMAS